MICVIRTLQAPAKLAKKDEIFHQVHDESGFLKRLELKEKWEREFVMS